MTPEKIIEFAREAGFINLALEPKLTRFAQLVAEHEREECANVCEKNQMSWADDEWNNAVNSCAEAIRARGEK